MKIAVIHSFYRSGASGENRAVRDQISALLRAGHETHLFGTHAPENVRDWKFLAKAGLRVATGFGQNPFQEISTLKPDVVHVHNLFPNWGSNWLKRLNTPLVASIHNYRSVCASGTLFRDGNFCDACPKSGSYNALKYRCYKGSLAQTVPLALHTARPQSNTVLSESNKLIFLSELSKRDFFDYVSPSLSEKSVVIPNFVSGPNSTEFQPNWSKRSGWLFAGYASRNKGLLELVEHWPKNLGLEVLGDGPDLEDAKHTAEGKNITFHGILPRSKVLKRMSRAKGVIFPSFGREHSPLVFIEALSAGTPVITWASSAQGIEVIQKRIGSTFSSMLELPQAIQIVEDGGDELSANARAYFETNYSERVWRLRMEELYKEVCSAETR